MKYELVLSGRFRKGLKAAKKRGLKLEHTQIYTRNN